MIYTTLAVLLLSAATVPQQPAAARRTVWDGVYTTAQAERGQAAYTTNCSRCHMDNLAGKGTAPSLKSEKFMEDWREYPLESLFTLIRTDMPPRRTEDSPRISDADYLDILTYILQGNAFPPGNAELGIEALNRIQIVRKEGPSPLPSGSMVLTAGCLLQLSETNWTLIDASEPVRAAILDRTTPEQLRAAASMPPGYQKFRLVNYDYIGPDFNLEPYMGQKIQVRGYLIRQPDAERINVTSVDRLAPACGQ